MGEIVLVESENFGGHFLLRDSKGKRLKLPCYTKKQIKAFHPNQHSPPSIVGACRLPQPSRLTTNQSILWKGGLLSIGPYKRLFPLFYHIKGYLPCKKEGSYVLLYQSHRICLLLFSFFLCFSILLFAKLLASPDVPPVDLDENAVSWTQKEKNYPSDKLTFDGMIEMKVNHETDYAKVTFHNPKSNRCYAIVSLWIQTEQGWEELYQSGLLGPGQALYQIQMNHPVPQGRYSAYVKYKGYTLQDRNPLNEVIFHFPFISE